MEVLRPLDHRQLSSHSDWYSQYKYRSGLASPKSSTAQSSPEFLDRSRMKADSALSFRPEGERSMPSYEPSTGSGSRHSPRLLGALPPIPTASKPSLPPIRALLAEPLRSPPSTPSGTRRDLQSLSQQGHNESEYTHQHKRSCSNLAWERRSSHASPASAHSMSLPSLDGSIRRDSGTTQSAFDGPGYRQPEDPYSRHRLSNAFLPEIRTSALEPRATSPDRAGGLPRPVFSRKRSYDSMGASLEREQRLPPPMGWSGPTQGPLLTTRRPSYHPVSPPPPPFRPYSTTGAPMTRPPMIDGHAMIPHPHSAVEAGSPPGMYPRPPVYDYQLSKARKRSNLPKESTDIMKRWFEAHLDNPYPSEDEKKFFAQKAGINLTQVSNWFINHRRRCPELREQRDKKQTTGRRTGSDSP
ncbi:hypothetical protein K461DRAFT_274813 [Myriangium duriaei CBS 260.36]|uniref:Homeobox domain-containing protein n=1 Tax=Myriangium duriaei CBS 260.36 TaxID=1168546 RepID=A0A9P4J5H0_9PEZI|nr:hypothetical protein K461DRAFT_274813 [Myriangium duriaei CBS 260.36]